MPSASEFLAQLGEVLDDPVVDDRDRTIGRDVGVGVDVVGPPWVAQRVCPMPTVVSGSGASASAFSRFANLPARLRDCTPTGVTTATPAESYPRYSRRRRPSTTTCVAS
jgi:hypothetical protein